MRYTINIMSIGRFCNEDTARPTRMIIIRIKTTATADYFDLFSDRSRQISDGIEGGRKEEAGRKEEEAEEEEEEGRRRLKRRRNEGRRRRKEEEGGGS